MEKILPLRPFMRSLQSKAEINLDSAEVLHTKGYYPSVAHCSYYSCFQLVRHIWLNSLGKTESELKQLIASFKDNKAVEKGSHDVLINQITTHIKLNNEGDFRVFNNNIGQLKRLRHSADYDDVGFSFQESEKSIYLSKLIRPVLKRY
ncbi:MAG: HEPN domain-containing protein [Bacteroidaceae bacterium]|nr:HEPN domain-containing protein [Bacteroidaceae bacterium]MEA4975685.1 HEPN domain-containing protein [Paludibacter sp.]